MGVHVPHKGTGDVQPVSPCGPVLSARWGGRRWAPPPVLESVTQPAGHFVPEEVALSVRLSETRSSFQTQSLMLLPFGCPRSCKSVVSPRLSVAAGLGAASSEPCDREGEPLPPGLVPMPLLVEGCCWACGASAPALCLPVRRGDAASALHPKFHWCIFHSGPCESGGVCQAVSNGSRLGETWASVCRGENEVQSPSQKSSKL